MRTIAQTGTRSARWPTGRPTRRFSTLQGWAEPASAIAIALALLCATGCRGSSASSGDVAAVVDAGVDAEVHVPAETAAEAAIACYSPLQPEIQPEQLSAAGVRGCECETYGAEDVGPRLGRVYCLSGRAVYCPKEKGTWIVGFDGPCSPLGGPKPLEVCTQNLGGDAVAPDTACPSGFAAEYGFQSAADANALVVCCYPIRVSEDNCTQAGLEVLESVTTGQVLQTTCSNGNTLRAFVGESGTTVCCERD
jgi:hypothetical protein